MRLAAIAIILCIGNITRLQPNSNVRVVEALTFIALGMAIGVLIANFVQYRSLKNNS